MKSRVHLVLCSDFSFKKMAYIQLRLLSMRSKLTYHNKKTKGWGSFTFHVNISMKINHSLVDANNQKSL